jgi:hypothetical protein
VRRRTAPRAVRARLVRLLPAGLAAAVVLVSVEPARADTTQWWPTLSILSPAGSPWRGSFEVQTRLVNDEVDRLDGFNRHVVRLQGGRRVHPRATLGVGYEKTWPIRDRTRHEQRTWQQFETSHTAGRWTLASRARVEQRFLRLADGTAHRVRYRFQVVRAVDARALWAITASQEIAAHLNTVAAGPRRGVDQHRSTLGVQRRTGPLSIEQTYGRQQITLPGRDPVNHLLQTIVTVRF